MSGKKLSKYLYEPCHLTVECVQCVQVPIPTNLCPYVSPISPVCSSAYWIDIHRTAQHCNELQHTRLSPACQCFHLKEKNIQQKF